MTLIKSMLFAAFSFLTSTTILAAGMKPEVPVLFIDDQHREATINIKNTDSSTALLHSKLQIIPEDPENKLIITPQLARVDAGKKQQVRVVLMDGIKLDKQRMQRIHFIAVPQDDGKRNRARVLVGQNIPVIISPGHLPVNTTPWTGLTFQHSDTSLKIDNPSSYIVRLTTQVDLLPGKQSIALPKTYILPGETLTLPLTQSAARDLKSIRLHPVTRFGILTTPFDVQL